LEDSEFVGEITAIVRNDRQRSKIVSGRIKSSRLWAEWRATVVGGVDNR
jgi:hypothetical protein